MILPQSVVHMLADLQSLTTNQVAIGGGFLRDLDHDIEPKDIDVFIGAGSGDEALGLSQTMGAVQTDDPEARMYPENMSEIQLVADCETDYGLAWPVQFIYINWQISNVVERFDYGLCQIMFDGTEIRWSEAYAKDRDNCTMTLLRCDNEYGLGRSVERFARWKPRYPTHRFVLGCQLDMGPCINGLDFIGVP